MIHCTRCGRRLTPDTLKVYSSFTHAHYCANLASCTKRAKRNGKRKVTA